MRYDIHVHAFGPADQSNQMYLCPEAQRSIVLRHLVRRMNRIRLEAGGRLDAVRTQMDDWMSRSQLDRFVLLALDKVHRPDGSPDIENTRAAVDNDYVADWAVTHPKVLFGASIHPLRADALPELDRLALRNACLMKWIPSAQNIAPDDPRCIPFYDRLAKLGIPLLSHAGIEHTLSVFDQDLNAPRRLRLPLERGVTVIAAHCGTRMYLHERSAFSEWKKMALEHPNFYGDISAFGLPVHGGPRRTILRDTGLREKILFGSDFPAHALPLWFPFPLGPRRSVALHRIANPFDKTAQTMRELGMPEEAFTRAHALLRLPRAPVIRHSDQEKTA